MSETAPEPTPAFTEDQLSQIPALHLLQNLGYSYLLPSQALAMRGGRESQVLLVDVLARQLAAINRVRYRGEELPFTEGAIAEAVRQLRDVDQGDGLLRTNQKVWDLLRAGESHVQTIRGDMKSFRLRYVDWEQPANNVFHVTDEFSVARANGAGHYRPDIVLFVNGIPFAAIECKAPGIKEPIPQAISQHLRNQGAEGIPGLFHCAQVLLSVAVNEASFGTVGTAAKFWANWKERELDDASLARLVNTPLSEAQLEGLFKADLHHLEGVSAQRARAWYERVQSAERLATEQDRLLNALCRPERLLDLARVYTVFDAGERKVARYPQYFCVRRAMNRLRTFNDDGSRRGGVVWHTQGTGKSITMVMLAEAIIGDPSIANEKIVLVTDRVDLDTQIKGNFRNCGAEVEKAATGTHLLDLLADPKARIITTVIHKFEAAVKGRTVTLDDPNIFVMVDEGHRTQFGPLHAHMKRTLPKACYLGFTGTPVMKADRSTLAKFGGLIDTYTIDEAVADKAVVPLLYEGRLVDQDVDRKPIDAWFARITRGLTKQQAADLKKKFATANQLSRTEQTILRIAWDVSEHFRRNWKGTSFKGQLVACYKADALLYKKYLDQFGAVSSEVLISPPDTREGYEEVDEVRDAAERPSVLEFWKRMMERFGSETEYQKQLIARFKQQDEPEIIIVVDKLLVGFDAPRNTVLYLTRKLEGHSLLQAIARVNRLHEGKDHGFILDYAGVLRKLGEALDVYGSLGEEFDADDVAHAVRDIAEETSRLPQRHADLWDVFKTVRNKHDSEAMELALEPEELRERFYERLTDYARTLQVALSSAEFYERTDEAKVSSYKRDLEYFARLRASVQRRYGEKVSFKQYEARIQKLLDTHVGAGEVEVIVNPVSIFDREAFQREIEQLENAGSKAHTIANRVKRAIHERMEDDPAFYQRFSEMIERVIADYRQQRINDAAFLNAVEGIRDKVRDRTGDDVPESLRNEDVAKAYFGLLWNRVSTLGATRESAAELAMNVDRAIRDLRIVNWTQNLDQQNRMRTAIEDEIFALKERIGVVLDFDAVDDLIEKCLAVARVRMP